MSRKFLAHINLAKNEIQNAIIQNLATAPAAPIPGQIYYNTTSGRFEYYSAAAWVDPTSRANHTGTQPVATITGLAAIATSGSAADLSAGTLPAARFDDVAHGARAGGTTHSVVLAAGAAGFMTGADKTKLDGVAAGATANSTDAILLARANHTGTQLAATISNFDTQVRTSSIAQMTAPIASVNVGGQLLINVATPVSATDATNKGYVDALVNGTDWKLSVRVASTANSLLSGLLTLDGITVAAGDRVLLKNQTVGAENGIYVASSGAWTRATDADVSAEVTSGMAMMVTEGTTQGDTQWVLTTNDPIVIGTTALVFAQIGGSTSYTASTGISITGNSIAIDTAVVARKFAALVGAGTSVAITHNLNTLDVTVQVYEVADGATVECDVIRNTVNQVTLGFAIAVVASAFRVVVQG